MFFRTNFPSFLSASITSEYDEQFIYSTAFFPWQNMYAQLLPLALPAPPIPGMGGPGMGAGFAPPPPMGGMGMPPMPPFGMPPMGSY